MAILEVQGLRKTYPGFALRDVSFCLEEDCITGFIGANGAGKTTTLRCLLGLAPFGAGSVKAFGLDMATHANEIKNRIGVVLDGDCFYSALTLAETASILAPAYSEWDDRKFRTGLDKFSLLPKQTVGTLSRGMRMKFALALALSHGAELLVMDEPTGGLDPLVRRSVLGILQDFMDDGGKGVFFSTHITSDLDRLADMLILIDRGRILWQQGKDELLETHRLVKGAGALPPCPDSLFLSLAQTPYGYEGITTDSKAAKTALGNVLLEKPLIEDIMLGYLAKGDNTYDDTTAC